MGSGRQRLQTDLPTCDQTVDLFMGYRYMNLSDSVNITESIVSGANAPDPIGTHTSVLDSFGTRNMFNGGQIGAVFEQRRGNWFANVRASVAFGVNDQTIEVAGYQVQTRPARRRPFSQAVCWRPARTSVPIRAIALA